MGKVFVQEKQFWEFINLCSLVSLKAQGALSIYLVSVA